MTPTRRGHLSRNEKRAGERGNLNIVGWIVGEGALMLGTLLIVLLILVLLGALPRWSHSRNWGYVPTGGVGLALLIVVILVLLGRL